MTLLSHTSFKTIKTLGVIGLTTLALSSASAMATDSVAASQNLAVKSAADGNIRAGASAFKKGDYSKSAMFSRAALKSSLSKSKQAIAQSNLCAAYAAMGEHDDAVLACDAALELRPTLVEAQTNKAALDIKLVENAETK